MDGGNRDSSPAPDVTHDARPTTTVVETADGSHSLYVPAFAEHYHSTHGALQESRHVFIDAGFRYILKNIARRPLRILEMGFGTGLNAWLTLLEAERNAVDVYYEAIEKYPLPQDIVAQLNYGQLLPSAHLCFARLHQSPWALPGEVGSPAVLSPHFTLSKRPADLRDYRPTRPFDLIYFDAFAPAVQPELWTDSIFKKLYDGLADGGALVTYSSKGTVKTALRKAGFSVARLPGAAGKRHMLRAEKQEQWQ
jgi:tRNA U34 5-methylaminomethyl-2-thiouridine-forming methyltransferase MnmC